MTDDSNRIRLESGKYPARLLGTWLSGAGRTEGKSGDTTDRRCLVGPGIGEDAAVIDPVDGADDGLIVVTSDPITFTSNRIGEYAITINANDIATTGGVGRWFFATVLMPPGIEAGAAGEILTGISTACGKRGIVLAGGHTEITGAVTRPVVSGTMIGTVTEAKLIDKRNISAGDVVLVTKSVAIEGTSILIAEKRDGLESAGVRVDEMAFSGDLLDMIDIRAEARLACEAGGVSAMHDVTEGGIVSALYELGNFGRLRIDLDLIPVMPECVEVCNALGIDPLGLIASGSLLIVCSRDSSDEICRTLADADIRCTAIGTVTDGASGVLWHRSGVEVDPPVFEVDEIARVLG